MTIEEYITLVTRNLEGTLSPGEFELLNNETARREDWAQTRLELEDIWDATGGIPTLVKTENTESLIDNIINAQAKQKEVKSIAKIFSIGRAISLVAASILLLITARWLMEDQTTIYNKAGVYVLSDKSKVTLRSDSQLEVYTFDNNQRKVRLIGEAFFEVAKDQKRPFSVVTDNVKIEVLGTSFLVKEKAEMTFVELIEGKIRTLDRRSDTEEVLTAGMRAQHMPDGSVDVQTGLTNLAAWRSGYYRFNNVVLGDAISELASLFELEIIIEKQKLKDCNFSANIAGNNIDEILKRIATIHKMELTQQGSKWILSGGSCD